MKVSELIQLLSWCDRDYEVFFQYDGTQYENVDNVSIIDLNGKKTVMLNRWWTGNLVEEIRTKGDN